MENRTRSSLESKYNVDESTGCWNWIGCKSKKGYGKINRFLNGKRFSHAHRYFYAVLIGGDLGDYYVLHTCDNRGCVNPQHLFLGTQQDNMDDMRKKGRAYSGYRVSITHCPQGHKYTKENILIRRNSRYCKACNNFKCWKRHWGEKLFGQQGLFPELSFF